jgi:hypothetical protein
MTDSTRNAIDMPTRMGTLDSASSDGYSPGVGDADMVETVLTIIVQLHVVARRRIKAIQGYHPGIGNLTRERRLEDPSRGPDGRGGRERHVLLFMSFMGPASGSDRVLGSCHSVIKDMGVGTHGAEI